MTLNLANAQWLFTSTQPNAILDSIDIETDLENAQLNWLPAQVPGTVAQSLRLAGQEKSLAAIESDSYDWWYSCEFSHAQKNGHQYHLSFAGLATLAEVWLNNRLILSAQNMFVPETIAVTEKLQPHNQLIICFRSTAEFLQEKRPRPRWKTNLVDNQQLRWLRTSLLGRIPGWCPNTKPIGPWRDIVLTESHGVDLVTSRITNIVADDLVVNAEFELALVDKADANLSGQLMLGSYILDLVIRPQKDNRYSCSAKVALAKNDLWWPHTHGQPTLLDCRLLIKHGHTNYEFNLGQRGFKQLHVNRDQGLVEITINQTPIFCRGACWTIADIETLNGTSESLQKSLRLARDAGLNMLRIGGTMVYESNYFYQLCDQLGIMVWQDFMFANMDYPVTDEIFHANIIREATAQLNRLAQYACISVYCGNSEVQQQAAMMGQTAECWSNSFFDSELRGLCTALHPGSIYFPSTPCEGALPFSITQGISHYYGVGAYKRPLNDAVIATVKFTPETLGISNIPEQNTIDSLLNGNTFTAHDPQWKKNVPRDSSAGWDFEDIRDFYLAQLFKQDPISLRSHNPQRYLELSRVVSSEIMLRTLANWRAPNHPCRGALIWFYKDIFPGAGWGLLDSNNQPKAAYYGVKRASAKIAVYFLDKGLDGLFLNLINETDQPKNITLNIKAFKHGDVETLSITKSLTLTQAETEINLNEWLGYFNDLNYSYGFGPKQQDVVYAVITDTDSNGWIHDDCYFVADYNLPPCSFNPLHIDTVEMESGLPALKISSQSFLQFVHIDIDGYECSDKYFHLAPGTTRMICLTATTVPNRKIKGYVSAVNLVNSQKFSQ